LFRTKKLISKEIFIILKQQLYYSASNLHRSKEQVLVFIEILATTTFYISTYLNFQHKRKQENNSDLIHQKYMALKVVTNEKYVGLGSWQMIDIVSDRGDRCPFLFLFGRHLGLILFPFPLTPAQ
jgi:hypothetical protein